jgi:subtilase family serine protease
MRRPIVRLRAAFAMVAVGLAGTALGAGGALAAGSSTSMAQIPGSYLPAGASETGPYSSPSMSVEVVLQPGNEAGLNSLLTNLYTPGSAQFEHWLPAGQFQTEFAPSAAIVSGVTSYLEGEGLLVQPTSSPFLLRASGSSAQVEAAFATPIRTYRSANGTDFFSNAAPASLPSTLVPDVLGVVGLTDTVRLQSAAQIVPAADPGPSGPGDGRGGPGNGGGNGGDGGGDNRGGQPACEVPYPTSLAQLQAITALGQPFNGYGGGPGCSGLTPSQTNSLYDAPNAGPTARGAGATIAVFELSAYKQSDVTTWAHTFYGDGYTPRITDINVDGGPLAPTTALCPTGDTCVYGYGGDIEVDADVQQALAIAPDINRVLVYNAPNDFTGQTELDEYSAIANQDTADSISSSWGLCEQDAGLGYAQAENEIFEQMAAQGQSMFSSSGDTGAFDCIRDGTAYGNPPLAVGDPATQPWVTSVGGTSFESFDPGSNPNPRYPRGTEAVWNTLDLCSVAQSGAGGYCAAYGAGGGGHSIFWPMPNYQRGIGVINPYTVFGTSNCALAGRFQPCREVPDVSANADPLTGYAEYCTGSSYVSPNPLGGIYTSACATINPPTPGAPGWFHIGGTSLSSPLWASIFADRDAYQHHRAGNANYLLYSLYDNPFTHQSDFHSIRGFGQPSNNNGYYPVTPFYNMATGIGTPDMTGLITGRTSFF